MEDKNSDKSTGSPLKTSPQRLDVTEETVRRLLRGGELPGMQISKPLGWRVRIQDVDAFIRSRFRTSKTSGGETIE
jgi:hypothetical protein